MGNKAIETIDNFERLSMMTDDLTRILESKKFRSSFKCSDQHYEFTFKDGYIGRDGVPIGQYQLIKTNDEFKLTIIEKLENIDTSNFVNVTLMVSGDEHFPLIINFDSRSLQEGKGFDMILEAV